MKPHGCFCLLILDLAWFFFWIKKVNTWFSLLVTIFVISEENSAELVNPYIISALGYDVITLCSKLGLVKISGILEKKLGYSEKIPKKKIRNFHGIVRIFFWKGNFYFGGFPEFRKNFINFLKNLEYWGKNLKIVILEIFIWVYVFSTRIREFTTFIIIMCFRQVKKMTTTNNKNLKNFLPLFCGKA